MVKVVSRYYSPKHNAEDRILVSENKICVCQKTGDAELIAALLRKHFHNDCFEAKDDEYKREYLVLNGK